MALQKRNDEQVELLRSDFQARYEPNFAWRAACSCIQALPGLRAFYPMSAVGTSGEARDLGGSGSTYDLTNNNSADFGYDQLVPYCEYNGTDQYHSLADNANFDILGTETYIVTEWRGLTVGGWFYFDDDTPAAQEHLIAKWTATTNRAYVLRRDTTADMRFAIYDSVGAAVDSVDTVGTIGSNQWAFCAGRFEPQAASPTISVVLKTSDVDEIADNDTGIPAALVNSNAAFTIGASGVPGNYLDGRASLCFVCAAMLSDAILDTVFHQTRAMYGV